MKKLFLFMLVLTVAGSLQSCFVYKNGPASAPSLSRYKSLAAPLRLDDSDAPIAINIIASLNPEPADTPKGKTIMDLKGPGQSELISQYAKFYDLKPGEFQNALNTVYLNDKRDSSPADFSNKSVAVTISVTKRQSGALTKKDLGLADRLENIKMEFKLDTGLQGIYFKSWDKVKTQYGRFFIGSRSFTGNQEININPSVTLASSAAFSLGNADSKSQYTEQDTLTQLTVVSNGILNEDSFTLEQTGTPKTSLLGNSIINLQVGTKTPVSATYYSFDKLYQGGKISPLHEVKMNLRNYWISDNSRDVTGTLVCTYRFRHVTGADRTYAESDDSVQYEYGRIIQTDVPLIRKKDAMPAYWYIRNQLTQQIIEVRDLLNTSVGIRDLAFASEAEAVDFLGWLIQVSDPASKFLPAKRKGVLAAAADSPVPLVFNNRYALVTTSFPGGGVLRVTPVKTGDATKDYRVGIFQLH